MVRYYSASVGLSGHASVEYLGHFEPYEEREPEELPATDTLPRVAPSPMPLRKGKTLSRGAVPRETRNRK